MPADNRDRDIVEHILRYCEQIETADRGTGWPSFRRIQEEEHRYSLAQNPWNAELRGA